MVAEKQVGPINPVKPKIESELGLTEEDFGFLEIMDKQLIDQPRSIKSNSNQNNSEALTEKTKSPRNVEGSQNSRVASFDSIHNLSVETKPQIFNFKTNCYQNIPANFELKSKLTNEQRTISKTFQDAEIETTNKMSTSNPRKRGRPKKNILSRETENKLTNEQRTISNTFQDAEKETINKTERESEKTNKMLTSIPRKRGRPKKNIPSKETENKPTEISIKKCSIVLRKINLNKDTVYVLKSSNLPKNQEEPKNLQIDVFQQHIGNNLNQNQSETQDKNSQMNHIIKKEIQSPKIQDKTQTIKAEPISSETSIAKINFPKNAIVPSSTTIRDQSKLLKNNNFVANEPAINKNAKVSDISIDSNNFSVGKRLKLESFTEVTNPIRSKDLSVLDLSPIKSGTNKIKSTNKQINSNTSDNKLVNSFFKPDVKTDFSASKEKSEKDKPDVFSSDLSKPKVYSDFKFLLNTLSQKGKEEVESEIKCGTCSQSFRNSDQLVLHIQIGHCS